MYTKNIADYSYIKVCRYCKIYVGKVPHTPIDFRRPSSDHLVTLFILIRNIKLCRCIIHLRSPVCLLFTCLCSFRVGALILWDLGLNWATLGCDSLPGVPASLDELGTHALFEVLRTFFGILLWARRGLPSRSDDNGGLGWCWQPPADALNPSIPRSFWLNQINQGGDWPADSSLLSWVTGHCCGW